MRSWNCNLIFTHKNVTYFNQTWLKTEFQKLKQWLSSGNETITWFKVFFLLNLIKNRFGEQIWINQVWPKPQKKQMAEVWREILQGNDLERVSVRVKVQQGKPLTVTCKESQYKVVVQTAQEWVALSVLIRTPSEGSPSYDAAKVKNYLSVWISCWL